MPHALRYLLIAPILMMHLCLAGAASAQGRGMGGGMPGGPLGGIPGGGVGHFPSTFDPPSHRPAGSEANEAGGRAFGQERAAQAQSERLSKPQIDRAAALAKAYPANYELDRHGALIIRGEVLVMGLDPAQLARLERQGFSILRRSAVADLGITLVAIARDGQPAVQTMRALQRAEPRGSYALNHVMFESGRRNSPQRRAAQPASPAGANGPVNVGLIDTGVARAVDNGRVRVIRRNFAPGESKPELHGTAVASLLAREPGPVVIYAADIFGSDRRGGTSELLIEALGWMAGARVPVINVSIIGPPNPLVGAVTGKLIGRGFTIVAPVGNDGAAGKLLFPASYPGVVAVSGAGPDGRLLPEASRVSQVDFAAPGIATVPDIAGRGTLVRGTSFAAPVVSRMIADHVRAPDPVRAREALRLVAASATRPRSDRKYYGRGFVDGR
ncbi:S8 family serine peptidase [Sphingomonas lycopersici]|nr:S8 family serine peptidase [Sphingomonas lycopersici]